MMQALIWTFRWFILCNPDSIVSSHVYKRFMFSLEMKLTTDWEATGKIMIYVYINKSSLHIPYFQHKCWISPTINTSFFLIGVFWFNKISIDR